MSDMNSRIIESIRHTEQTIRYSSTNARRPSKDSKKEIVKEVFGCSSATVRSRVTPREAMTCIEFVAYHCTTHNLQNKHIILPFLVKKHYKLNRLLTKKKRRNLSCVHMLYICFFLFFNLTLKTCKMQILYFIGCSQCIIYSAKI